MPDTLPFIPSATYQSHPSERAWLAARCNGCGSSDTAGIVGYSKWNSQVSVWDKKVNRRIEDQSRDVLLRVGHALEPLASQLFTEDANIEVVDPGDYAIYTSIAHPWLFATVDRLTHDGRPLELKTAWYGAADEWKERVPLAYQIQCQHQLAVLDADEAYIAVILNGTGFKWHTVKRHPLWIEAIIERTGKFWRDFVLTGKMPPVDGSEATRKVLESLYPVHNETIVDLPEDWTKRARHWDRLQRHETKCKKIRDKLANELRAAIGGATYAREPMGSGWKWNGRLTRKSEIREHEYV